MAPDPIMERAYYLRRLFVAGLLFLITFLTPRFHPYQLWWPASSEIFQDLYEVYLDKKWYLPFFTLLFIAALILIGYFVEFFPLKKWCSALNTAISLGLLIFFERNAISVFGEFHYFFIMNQILATIFTVAFFLSFISLRDLLVKQ